MQEDDQNPEDQQKGEAPSEGVRLVRRDEADAAIEAGDAISRARSQQPPFLRRVESTPDVVRLPQSSDVTPGPIAIKPVAPVIITDDEEILNLTAAAERNEDEVPEDRSPSTHPDEPVTDVTALPHWTEPPTGEMPAAIAGGEDTGGGRSWELSDLGEASGLGGKGTIDDDDFADDIFTSIGEKFDAPVPGTPDEPEAVSESADAVEDEPVPAPPSPVETELTEEERVSIPRGGARFRTPSPTETAKERVAALANASFARRVITGVVAAGLALIAFSAGPAWALTYCTAVVLLSAIEYFDAVRRVGYRPATALGLVAVAGAILGTYARGEAAIPLVLALSAAFVFLWYLTGVIKESPTANTAITLLGIVWIGIFGSYAALLLREPDHRGIAFLIGAVLVVAAYDTAAYVGGNIIGKHKLAPSISPGKTWEGLVVGTIAAVVVGGIVVQFIHPWSFTRGLLLGLVVAVVAPIGDLAESMVKRDLGLKDMGRLLPGHGGVLDRFDALLFVLPATYYLVRMLDLV